MKSLLKNAREAKGFKTRELAKLAGIDQALISKFESGTRHPTKIQVQKLSQLLDIDFETLMLAWLKGKILHEIKNEPLGLKALKSVEAELSENSPEADMPQQFQKLLDEMNSLKSMLTEKKS